MRILQLIKFFEFQASNCYPFGWQQPNRQYANSNYRYGFNGTEKSPEISNGHQTTFFRQNDTRIGRWWSTDPVTHHGISPYNSMNNNPISLLDPNGDTPFDHIFYLVFEEGHDKPLANEIAKSTQMILDLNKINLQVQVLYIDETMFNEFRQDASSALDGTDALTFVGSVQYTDAMFGRRLPGNGGYNGASVGYVSEPGILLLMKQRASEDMTYFVEWVARAAVHEGAGHEFPDRMVVRGGGAGHPNLGDAARYSAQKNYTDPGDKEYQNIMTSGNETFVDENPYTNNALYFLEEDLDIIKSAVPDYNSPLKK